MRVSWNTESLGVMHATVEDERVLEMVSALVKLGFTPEVTLDTPSEN